MFPRESSFPIILIFACKDRCLTAILSFFCPLLVSVPRICKLFFLTLPLIYSGSPSNHYISRVLEQASNTHNCLEKISQTSLFFPETPETTKTRFISLTPDVHSPVLLNDNGGSFASVLQRLKRLLSDVSSPV